MSRRLFAGLSRRALGVAAVASASVTGMLTATCTTDEKVYTAKQVAHHKSRATGVWMMYGDGVYDVTDFIPNHPGGSTKIMQAAGGSIEPFWKLYAQHYNTSTPYDILSKHRIGALHPDDVAANEKRDEDDASDPYGNEPDRDERLVSHGATPYNAEVPHHLLGTSYLTPNELWFTRNHHPTPDIDADMWRLEVSGKGVKKPLLLSLQDLHKFERVEIVASIQCGGNRRGGLNAIRKTFGTAWGAGAISTARFAGVRMRDVLREAGVKVNKQTDGHLQMFAADDMQVSIPLHKAVLRDGDVILAYEMNGQPLPRDHGYPVRVVVPGYVGVRNVKWVERVHVADVEATGPWQTGMNYKGFNPSTTSLTGLDLAEFSTVMEMPVQSVILSPPEHYPVAICGKEIEAKGFAYAGGGRGIVRVDVSADGGKTWYNADLNTGAEQPANKAWAWTMWECKLPTPPKGTHVELVVKAVDASYNVQPENIGGIWNLRGLCNNAWHRVKLMGNH